jgi:HEAT repeat protein
MKRFWKYILAAALTSLVLILASPLRAADSPEEDKLIAQLASPEEKVVTKALLNLEKKYPTSPKAHPTARKLLSDSRPAVQRKAARYLGELHVKVDEAELKIICGFLTSSDQNTVLDGLKALRGLDAASTVPQILPCLKSNNIYIKRDACRTLAVLGNKELIPQIEPLLQHEDPRVKKDAQDAIAALKAK